MAEQIIMQGIVTESDVVRAYMRKLGSRGGGANTPAQLAHRKRAMAKINEAKRKKIDEQARSSLD